MRPFVSFGESGCRLEFAAWERHRSELTNTHGPIGDIIFLGAKTGEARAHPP